VSGRNGAMAVLGGLAGLLLVIAAVSGWQGAARLRGQGDDIHDVEEATRQFVEAYGTFDFRDPEAHRERLMTLSTGPVFAAVATSPIDAVAVGQQQTVTTEVLTVQVTALSGDEATASATADQTRRALDPATGQLRTLRTRQHVNCRLIRTAGRWLIAEFRLVSEEPLGPVGR